MTKEATTPRRSHVIAGPRSISTGPYTAFLFCGLSSPPPASISFFLRKGFPLSLAKGTKLNAQKLFPFPKSGIKKGTRTTLFLRGGGVCCCCPREKTGRRRLRAPQNFCFRADRAAVRTSPRTPLLKVFFVSSLSQDQGNN